MHIAVLGGGGAMGRITCRALANDARVTRVTVVDLRLDAAERTVSWLEHGRDKAHAVACDVRDEAGLRALLDGASVVLNAADYPYNLDVMRAALAARAHYADLGGLFHMTRRQYELDTAFREAGLSAVLGIGSTPGITNVLARLAADQLDRVERLDVRIGSGDYRGAGAPFAPPYSMRTILDECTLKPMVYRNGRWAAVAPMSGEEAIVFPRPIERATAIYTLHSEVALFPLSFRDKGLLHASFKIAFPPEFLAQLKLLVELGLGGSDVVQAPGPERGTTARIIPREVLMALLARRQMPATEADDCDVLRVVAQGTRGDRPVELIEEMVVRPYRRWGVGAGDIDTGVPLAIAGILLAAGRAQLTGAHGAERIFDPMEFLGELAPYDMHATEMTTRTLG